MTEPTKPPEIQVVVNNPQPLRVVVTDIAISVPDLVALLIKLTIAAIPAAIIIGIVFALVSGACGGLARGIR